METPSSAMTEYFVAYNVPLVMSLMKVSRIEAASAVKMSVCSDHV